MPKQSVPTYQIPTPQLLPEEIEEFRQIVKKVKGVELTSAEAEDQAMRFIKLFRLVVENPTRQEDEKGLK